MSLESLYKLLVLSAGIKSNGFSLMRLILFGRLLQNSELTFLNSMLRSISYKSVSNASRCSFFGGVLTDLNPKLSTIVSGVFFPSYSLDKTF